MDKRGQYFFCDPHTVTIIGLDTKDGPEHPLWDERINRPLDKNLVYDIQAHGGTGLPAMNQQPGLSKFSRSTPSFAQSLPNTF